MTEIINIEKIKEKKIVKAIKEGKILVYPTDTVYGLGCDATNREAVQKIRMIKQREEKPFSIIAQSKPWIYKNFYVNKSYVQKLPGPFTFILRTKKDRLVSNAVTDNANVLAVRIPDHQFTKIIQKAKIPFVTTSVNLTGKKPITYPKQIPGSMLKNVDIVIDAGILENNPSTIIDLTGKIARIVIRNL